MCISKFVKQHQGGLIFIARIVIGLMILAHGLQKIFGVLGFTQVEIMSAMGFAGIVEILAGTAITLGFLSRLATALATVFMVCVYAYMHAVSNLVPLLNGGELALMYAAGFLLLTITGPGAFSLERAIWKKELF